MADDKLVQTVKMGVKRVGIQGARARAAEIMAQVDPLKCPNRYAIGFDDSGSMSITPIQDAKRAVAGFLGSCTPQETSVAIVPFSGIDNPASGVKSQQLTNNYDIINAYLAPVRATSGTPLYETMCAMMERYPITRGILFSDGQAGDSHLRQKAIDMAKEKKIPFDTVSLGGPSKELKEIAELTGGYYLEFTDTAVFAKSMKYLSPKYVALLSNAELKEKIQRGEQI